MGKRMKWYDWLFYALLVAGGLVHASQAFGYYPLDELLWKWLARGIKLLVGLSAVYALAMIPKLARK